MKKVAITKTIAILLSLSAFGQITNLPIEFDVTEALDELNDGFQGTGYPWLSEDGLRIYYASLPDTSTVILLYYSERLNIQDSFSNFQSLSINSPNYHNTSPWLSNDELTLYFVTWEANGNTTMSLYKATRNTLEDEFSNPILVQLLGDVDGAVVSPSLTPDGLKLYLWNVDSPIDNILIFEESGTNEFTLVDTLEVPVDYRTFPGKLGPNGLNFYFAMRLAQSDIIQMYVYQRNDINDDFTELFFLENDLINSGLNINCQPSIGCHGNCLGFVRADFDKWTENEIWLASRTSTSNPFTFKPVAELKTFPNPASVYTNFQFEVPEKYTNLRLFIFNGNGQLIKNIPIPLGTGELNLDLTDFIGGSYSYQLRSNELLLNAGILLVE